MGPEVKHRLFRLAGRTRNPPAGELPPLNKGCEEQKGSPLGHASTKIRLRLQRFLALITLRRYLRHRSRLAFELWPDSNERQARTNLRKLLHDFRLETIPSGHDLPAFRPAIGLLNDSG